MNVRGYIGTWLIAGLFAAGGAWAEAKGDDAFATEYGRHLGVTRRWSMHTQPCEILKDMPGVKAFIERETAKGGHEAELVTLAKYAIETYWRARDFKTGVAMADRLYANEKADYSARLEAARYLAMKVVDERGDYAAADAYYAKLAAMKPVHAFMRPDIAKHRAYLYTLRDDKAGAIRFLEQERAALDEKDTLGRGLYDERIAGVYDDFFDYAGAFAFWKERGNKWMMFKMLERGDISDEKLCGEIARDLVANASDFAMRSEAWRWLLGRDTAFCRANLDKVLGCNGANTNAFHRDLGQKFWITNLHCPQMTTAPAWNMNWADIADAWELYRDIGLKAGLSATFDAVRYSTIAYAGLREKAKARDVVRDGLALKNLKSEERYELGMMAAVLDATGSEDAIVRVLKEAEARVAQDSGVDAKERVKRFGRAGMLAVLLCDETLQRAVAMYFRTYMDPVKPRKTYTVKFTDRPVAGAGDWANIPFKPVESDFDRKFGGPGMEFMTTDVATGDRGSATQGGDKSRVHPTTLQAVADEWGVHFLYTFYDRRARQFESGELDAGSFESYIAAGDNQPYTCFMCRLMKRARASVMSTTYDMPGHRRVDGNDSHQMRSDVVFTDDAAMLYTAFSWDVFAEHVPADGGTWDFESVFWGPVQSAWNGTASIHGRSTWGLLRFELGDAARTKILKQQLFRAVKFYQGEKSAGEVFATSPQEGVFDHWQDDAVGDPAFYDACLKPLVAELDAAAQRVKVGMTDDDVKDISEKYLARFLDIRFEVARLRAAYLRRMVK